MSTWRSRTTRDDLFSAIENTTELIVLDTETTGLGKDDTIIQFSAQKYTIKDGKISLKESLDEYINPGHPLNPKITEITGITDEVLFDKPFEPEVLSKKIEPFMRGVDTIVAYNTPFDMRFIKAMYERGGMEFNPPFELDVLEMARDLVPKEDTKNHKLITMAELYGVAEGLSFHNAADDVTATALLLQAFIAEYKKQEECSDELQNVRVFTLNFWEGYRGFSRIYVNTSHGGLFYDIRRKNWCLKPDNPHDIKTLNMEQVRQDCFALAGAANEAEFARYRG